MRVQQVVDAPEMLFSIDRARAEQSGLTHARCREQPAHLTELELSDVRRTSGSIPKTGVNYQVAVQTPIYKMGTMEALATTPVSAAGRVMTPELLSNLVSEQRQLDAGDRDALQHPALVDVYASADGRDLGGVAEDIERSSRRTLKLPKGSELKMRGQVQSMRDSFKGLLLGIVFGAAARLHPAGVNFQSWIDPLIIVMALPGALSGVCGCCS